MLRLSPGVDSGVDETQSKNYLGEEYLSRGRQEYISEESVSSFEPSDSFASAGAPEVGSESSNPSEEIHNTTMNSYGKIST